MIMSYREWFTNDPDIRWWHIAVKALCCPSGERSLVMYETWGLPSHEGSVKFCPWCGYELPSVGELLSTVREERLKLKYHEDEP
jgi:hypothetical protein